MGRRRDVEHKCEVCGRGFAISGHLTRHKAIHTGERPYKCSEVACDKSYARKDNLNRHMLSAHSRDQWAYICDVSGCGKKFPTPNKLRRHRNLHERPTPYKCDECGAAFRKKRQLALHRTDHTGRLPYPCDEEGCDREFPTPSKLRKHKLWHSWGDERYVCLEGECAGKESFDKFSQLQKHLKAVHPPGPKECEECGRRFRTSSGLRKHTQTHESLPADRKKYRCEFAGCIAAFTSNSNLGSHIRSKHTQRGAFSCQQCERKFSYLVVLQRHMRSMHSAKSDASIRDISTDGERENSSNSVLRCTPGDSHDLEESVFQSDEGKKRKVDTSSASEVDDSQVLIGKKPIECAAGAVAVLETKCNSRKRNYSNCTSGTDQSLKRSRFETSPELPTNYSTAPQPDGEGSPSCAALAKETTSNANSSIAITDSLAEPVTEIELDPTCPCPPTRSARTENHDRNPSNGPQCLRGKNSVKRLKEAICCN